MPTDARRTRGHSCPMKWRRRSPTRASRSSVGDSSGSRAALTLIKDDCKLWKFFGMARFHRKVSIAVGCGLLIGAGVLFRLAWRDAFGGSRPTAETGFSTRVEIDTAGVERPYVLFVPHLRPSGEKPPVILYLNGYGENGE